jgi:site-specific DNA recombinase
LRRQWRANGREASEILRSLIDKVVLTPETGAPNWLKAELHGDLAAILSLCEAGRSQEKPPAGERGGSQLSVVAGAGIWI